MLVTSGTCTCDGPDETWRDTVLPCGACPPAPGDWLITWPAGTVSLGVFVQLPCRLDADSVCLAPSQVMPTTFGTFTLPVDTNSLTTVFGGITPALGSVRATSPTGSWDVIGVWVGTGRPRLTIVWVASLTDFPRRFGSVTLFGPADTMMVTCEPLSASLPCGGSVSITCPLSTFLLVLWSTAVVNPAWVSCVCACCLVNPRTSGTFTWWLPCSCW